MATASCTDSQLLCVEAVKSTFDRVMTDSEFSLSTPRIDLVKECLGCLQTKLDEADMVAFMDQLGIKLTSIVDNCFSSVTQSNSTQREKGLYTIGGLDRWTGLLDSPFYLENRRNTIFRLLRL